MSRANPGLMVFLIDCSASMAFPLLRSATDKNQSISKFEAAADILDSVLFQCTTKCASEDKYKDYVDFVILGYGDNVFSPISKISVSEYPISVNKLDNSFESVEEFSEEELGETMSPIKWINQDMQLGGITSMRAGFTMAKEIIQDFISSNFIECLRWNGK